MVYQDMYSHLTLYNSRKIIGIISKISQFDQRKRNVQFAP